MSEIRLLTVDDIDNAIPVLSNAYPGFPIESDQDKKDFREALTQRINDDPNLDFYIYLRDDRILAFIRLHNFTMNLFGTKILAGGGGALAVDLCHKKEHIAKEIVEFFFEKYRSAGSPLAVLWPFRPDFYVKMGAGLGIRTDFYKVRTSAFPRGSGKENIRFLTIDDVPALVDCYNRYASATNGMIDDYVLDRQIKFKRQKGIRAIGYFEGDQILGYMIFKNEKNHATNILNNTIRVTEWIYECPAALSAMSSFIRSQADQYEWIAVPTPDEDFHLFLTDPRNDSGNLHPGVYHECADSTIGIMYRVLCTEGIFRATPERDFNGVNAKVRFRTRDSFLPANDVAVTVHFKDGKAEVQDSEAEYDVELTLDISDFSSLIVGAVRLRSLWNYGKIELSDDSRLEQLCQLLEVQERPICLTQF